MKRCPACNTTYTDTSLRYCLADGNNLVDLPDDRSSTVGEFASDPTIVAGANRERMRVDIPGTDAGRRLPPPEAELRRDDGKGSSGTFFKVLLVLLGLGALAILAIVVGTLIYFYIPAPDRSQNRPVNGNEKVVVQTTPTPTATPANDETSELREQIANLEKRLNEQRSSNRPTDVPLSLPNQSTATRTASVYSPGDGFLALRTLPNADTGYRILKIPHGASLTVGGCQNVTRVGGKSGRWCIARYNGYTGWVFDAFLIY